MSPTPLSGSARRFNKSAFDACMKQATFFAGRVDQRRQYEWKISFGFWTLLALATGYLAGKSEVEWWFVLIPVVLHGKWLIEVTARNEFENEMYKAYRDEADNILRGSPLTVPRLPHHSGFRGKLRRTCRNWSAQFQFGCTVMLSFSLYWLTR